MRYISVFCLFLLSCTSAQVQKTLGDISDVVGTGELTESEVALGLKEALVKATRESAEMAGENNGFLDRPEIRIPFPEDIQKVEKRLRQIGLGNEVDRFVESMNHGAEKAASQAIPIFERAVKNMTVQDAWSILKGPDDAATAYLHEQTSAELSVAFKPVVRNALNEVNATRYYSDIISTYNKIPLVEKVDPDLENYVTQKALDGLFQLMEQEEKKIRNNPMERTTDLMRRVFSAQD
jgi:hypothetical protein